MDRDEFVEKYEPLLDSLAGEIQKKFSNCLKKDEIQQHGIMVMYRLYEKADLSNRGINSWVKTSLRGRLVNYANTVVKINNREIPVSGKSGSDDNPLEAYGTSHDPYFHVVRKELLESLGLCLDDMTPVNRFIYVTKILDGKSNDDISKLVVSEMNEKKVSRETIRRKIEPLQKKLKKCLEGKGWTLKDIEAIK